MADNEDKACVLCRGAIDRIGWKSVRVWYVPEMNRGEVDLPEVTFEPEEAPF